MIYEKLLERKAKLALVGLGYVGLPIAVAFSKKVETIGFDVNENKICLYKKGIDPTLEVGDDELSKSRLSFTANENDLSDALFFIVAVPTPVNEDKTPDLNPVIGASEIVGRNLSKGSIVVYESTVYPGVTEDICIPILEKESGLICGKDFKVGYSPERINPGDKEHRLNTIRKIVSGMDEESLDEIANVYSLVIDAGVFKAESIKVAEAAKVIENSQRDINIAFMNELSIIFHKLGIDTKSVLEAAGTKWNFLPFRPGLVGGHCIGIDPYYLTYKAQMVGYNSQVILSGRRINDGMGKYVAENIIKQLIKTGASIKDAKVGILGITFKENCPDVRNSKVVDIINELKEYGINPVICDPVADAGDVKKFYNVDLVSYDELSDLDALVIAVSHNEFKKHSIEDLGKLFKTQLNDSKKVLVDVKGLYNLEELRKSGYLFWRL